MSDTHNTANNIDEIKNLITKKLDEVKDLKFELSRLLKKDKKEPFILSKEQKQQVVKQYKQFMLEKGLEPYTNNKPDPKKGLQRWYNEKWIDIKTNKPCGSVKTQSYYPTCRPSKRVTAKSPITSNELTQKDKAHMIAQKQKAKSHTVYYKETTRI
jgi:hypothetical protein